MSHRNESSRTRIRGVCLLVGIALFVLLSASSSATPGESVRRGPVTAIDSDGDGIADDFDPDDDNDGVTDDQEGASDNPGPVILDPGKDTDTDGIPNVLDPDDNNNGVTDEEDPQSFPPSNGGGSSNPPGTGQPSTSPGTGSTGTSNQAQPDLLIRALPVTGSGSLIEENQLPVLLAAMTTLLGASATLLLAHRTPAVGRTKNGNRDSS